MEHKKIFTASSRVFPIFILIIGIVVFAAIFVRNSNKVIDIENEQIIEDSAAIDLSANDYSNSALNKKNEFVINEGDTLLSILHDANIPSSQTKSIIDAFSRKFNPRKLAIGTSVEIIYEDIPKNQVLAKIVVYLNNIKRIEIFKESNDRFSAVELIVPLVQKTIRKKAFIKNNFIATAIELSVSSSSVSSMVKAFSYDVDFQRDIKSGDYMEVVLDKFDTEDGKYSHTGNVLYASLTLSGKKISIYQFIHPDGSAEFYNENAESIKKEFLRTPINAVRISSNFGMRKHPILGYSKMHKGIDFAAPIGTPILAAASGTIEMASRYASYGKYIRIKHNTTYSTAYGHASRFAPGIRVGAKVNQGQVIAYVGSTGMSDGPHLHYEVIQNGKQINPLKFKANANSAKLSGKMLEKFKQFKKKIDSIAV